MPLATVAGLSEARLSVVVESSTDGAFRFAPVLPFAAATRSTPTPPATEARLVLPLMVHGPPVFADPQPPETVREKSSATTATGASLTLTSRAVDAVPAASSVTV